MRDVLVRCPQCQRPVIFSVRGGLFVSSRAVEATRTTRTIMRIKCRGCRTWIQIGEKI